MRAYEQTENGTTTRIPLAEGLEIINRAQMEGARYVRSMSQISWGSYEITYISGRTVRLVQVVVEDPAEAEEWSTTRAGSNLMHRFDPETLVGRCNRSYRPHRYGDGYSLEKRSDIEEDLYRVCPRCEGK